MNALPRLLYILQTASIHVPPTFFKTYKSLCSRFLWGERRPRISYTQLALPKHSGGVGLPELLKYYKAIHLSRISDWDVHASYKDWVNLEASFTDLPLRSLPLTLERHIPLEILSHPLIRPTIQCFCNVCKHTSLSSIPGPLTSIKINPEFPPGMHHQFLTDCWSKDQILAQTSLIMGNSCLRLTYPSKWINCPSLSGHIYYSHTT